MMTSVLMATTLWAGPSTEPGLTISYAAKRVKVELTSGGSNKTVLQSKPSKQGITLPWLARKSSGKVSAPPIAKSARTKLESGLLLTVGCNGVASDGTKTWKLQRNASLLLPDGTKLTFSGKGTDYCKKVDVMSGAQRVSIARSKGGKLVSTKTKNDRWAVDAKISDGEVYVLGADAGRYRDWATIRIGKSGIKHGKPIAFGSDGGMAETSNARAWQLTPDMLDALVGRGGGFSEVRAGPFGGILPAGGPVSGIIECEQGCFGQDSPESPEQPETPPTQPGGGQGGGGQSGMIAGVVLDNGSGMSSAQPLISAAFKGTIKGTIADRGVAPIARSLGK